MHPDLLSVSEMDDYPLAVLAEFLRDPDVLYGFAAIKKHDENILGNQP